MELRGQRKSEILLGFIMVYSLNLLIMKSLYYEISPLKTFTINMIIWFFSYIAVSYHRYLRKINILFFALLTFFLCSLLPRNILQILFFSKPDILIALKNTSMLIQSPKIIKFILWSVRYSLGHITGIPEGFDIILSIIIFIFVSISFANLMVRKKRFIYFILPILFFIFEWFRYIEGVTALFNIYILGLILYYISIIYNNKLDRINKKDSSFKYYDYKLIMVFGSIMTVIIIFTSNMIINTLSLGKLNDKISSIFPSVLELRSGYKRARESKFSFKYTPYQPLGNRLGGSITQKDVLVMRVKSNKPLLYLRGRVKNIYTGYNWYSDNSEFSRGKRNLEDMDKAGFMDSSETAEITIYPDNILTSTIFSPYFPLEIDTDGRKIRYNSDQEMYFVKGFFKGLEGSYTVKSILPTNEKGEINIKDTRDIERDRYLQLPDHLPERISKLARDLTEDYESDYEKIKAIETYLAKNYSYSLTVSDIPEGRDFVDNFLFEDKKGYCTYYASSLGVMARTVGIPTRYIEGFILPEDKGEGGLYEVKAERAHAWIEAYIDGVGWISFEPTSPYYVEENKEEIEADLSQEELSENQNLNNRRRNNLRRMMEEEDIPFGEGDFRYPSKKKSISLFTLIPVFLIMIIISRVLYLHRKSKEICSKTDPRKYIIKNYYIIISLYSFIKKLDAQRNSPFQAFKIIDKNLMDIEVSDGIINSINKAFYSNENISSEDIGPIDDLRSRIEKVVLSKIGKTAYIYHKYLLGDIYRKGDVYGTLRKNTSS